MNKKIGSKYEKIAKEYFIKKGIEIIEENVYSKYGEIDLLGYRDGVYYIIEVKFRKILENAVYSISKKQMERSLKTFYEYCETKNINFDQIYYITFSINNKSFIINLVNSF